MRQQLWLSVLVFHLAFGVASVAVALRWRRRLAGEGRVGGGAAIGDAGFLLAVALLAAGVGALAGARSGFTVLRLLAQGLFGEIPLLLAVVAGLLARAGRGRWGVALAMVPLALLAVYAEAYHRGPRDLRVSRHSIRARAETGRRLSLLHLSDIQTDRVGEHEERAIAAALAQPADLVLLTGDYVQPRVDPTREETTARLNALLRRLQAPLGVYAVEGDTDHDWPRVLTGTGIVPLTGEVARVALPGGGALSVVGLTGRMSHGGDSEGVLELVRSVPPGDLCLVAGHGPDFVIGLAGAAPVDLALAGHTHGGQVVLPLYGPPITKTRLPRRHARGMSSYQGLALHVSAGIGMERTTAPQMRFLCPPEICLIELRY